LFFENCFEENFNIFTNNIINAITTIIGTIGNLDLVHFVFTPTKTTKMLTIITMRYIINKHVEFDLEQWENNPGAAKQVIPCTNRG
jgi:hypothetical protein